MLTATVIALGLIAWWAFVKLLLAAIDQARDEEREADRIIDDVGLPLRVAVRDRRNAE